MSQKPTRRAVLAAGAAAISTPVFATFAAGSPRAPMSLPQGLDTAFDRAARDHDVPRDLLVALAQSLSAAQDGASAYGGHGVMQLVDGTGADTLGMAAELTGQPEARLRENTAANVYGAAALLRSLADDAGLDEAGRARVEAWYEPVVEYTGIPDLAVARMQADAVYAALAGGVTNGGAEARLTTAQAHATPPEVSAAAPPVQPMNAEYPQARWVAAHSSNYRVANRPNDHAIDRVVIHTAQGTYAGTISWFQNSSSNVSAHYVVRSSDGQVTQMVRHKDVGWHVGSSNNRSIGIEHEGWVDNSSWYTEQMYRSSAALTRYICNRHGLPLNRAHIVGHNEIPDATHTDPGRHWDWDRYMSYVRDDSERWRIVVDNDQSGFKASGNWARATASGYGGTHHHAKPVQQSDVAWFHARIPSTGSYRVDVWYPQGPTNNSRTPYLVSTTTGLQTVHMDQRSGGGRWNTLGTFRLEAGNRPTVGVSRWTGTEGWIEADAVRITQA
ncbi:N-acetylmuramoyl-L-alanine amidase [Phytoactinopolyspora mesophila]|nr:N-acetylmuramoyl-L-alanine amidase [Phytoactinopolyspora mesophila]